MYNLNCSSHSRSEATLEFTVPSKVHLKITYFRLKGLQLQVLVSKTHSCTAQQQSTVCERKCCASTNPGNRIGFSVHEAVSTARLAECNRCRKSWWMHKNGLNSLIMIKRTNDGTNCSSYYPRTVLFINFSRHFVKHLPVASTFKSTIIITARLLLSCRLVQIFRILC